MSSAVSTNVYALGVRDWYEIRVFPEDPRECNMRTRCASCECDNNKYQAIPEIFRREARHTLDEDAP